MEVTMDWACRTRHSYDILLRKQLGKRSFETSRKGPEDNIKLDPSKQVVKTDRFEDGVERPALVFVV
jgi:hypothetical protein